MGLLDDLLGGLAGQSIGGRVQSQPAPMGGEGGGISQALIALMPVVLGMRANRGSQGGSPGAGGIGGVLGQMLGGAAGGVGAAGGLGGLLGQVQQAGFGRGGHSRG